MTLKLGYLSESWNISFGTIQSNMTLKHRNKELIFFICFGTIQSNMTLKHRNKELIFLFVLELFNLT